jgi:hypothetical protein
VRLSLWGSKAAVREPKREQLRVGDLLVVTKYGPCVFPFLFVFVVYLPMYVFDLCRCHLVGRGLTRLPSIDHRNPHTHIPNSVQIDRFMGDKAFKVRTPSIPNPINPTF